MMNFNSTPAAGSEFRPVAHQHLSVVTGTALNLLSLEQAGMAFSRMSPMHFEPGDEVIKQGETGEHYYLLESGEAEVWRTDPLSDETSMVAVLGSGSVFGEEALLMEGNRNATVRMRSAGLVWTLCKNDFNSILRNEVLETIESVEAKTLIRSGEASWLDCRYEMEFEESHIPGAMHLPLDQLREHAVKLDCSKSHIVYCRSGRRSDAAAFLLRKRGFIAFSLKGGILGYSENDERENIAEDAQLATASIDLAQAITSDAAGNVYAAGRTDGALDGQTSAGGFDLFIVKYQADGRKR